MHISSLLKNTLTYGIGQILTRSISILLLPFFTNYLTPEDYGIISVLGFIITFSIAFLMLGIGTSFTICYGNATLDRRKIIATCNFIILITSFIGFFVFYYFAESLSFYLFRSDAYSNILLITYLTAVLNAMTIPFSLYLQFSQQALLMTIISVAYTLITIILNFGGVVVLKMGVHGQVGAFFFSTFSVLVLYWIVLYQQIQWKICFRTAKNLIVYGLPMIPGSFALFFLQNSQRYFLDQYSTLSELGLYTVGFNIASVANLFVSSFSIAWVPFVIKFQNKLDEAQIVFGKIFTYFTYFFGIIALGFFIFSRPVVQFMTNPSFYPSASVIGLVASSWIFIGYYNFLNTGLIFAKKLYINSIINFMGAGFAWGGNILLIKHNGMMGAAITFFGSHLFMVLTQVFYNYYFGFFHLKLEWRRLFIFSIIFLLILTINNSTQSFSLLLQCCWGISALGCLSLWCLYSLSENERGRIKNIFTFHQHTFKN